MKITFRKGKKYDGRMRLPETYQVTVDGRQAATLQSMAKQFTWEAGKDPSDPKCWFWYGDGVNTAGKPDTLEVCKAQVKAHFQGKPNTKT